MEELVSTRSEVTAVSVHQGSGEITVLLTSTNARRRLEYVRTEDSASTL